MHPGLKRIRAYARFGMCLAPVRSSEETGGKKSSTLDTRMKQASPPLVRDVTRVKRHGEGVGTGVMCILLFQDEESSARGW